jgi:hypothetical protein
MNAKCRSTSRLTGMIFLIWRRLRASARSEAQRRAEAGVLLAAGRGAARRGAAAGARWLLRAGAAAGALPAAGQAGVVMACGICRVTESWARSVAEVAATASGKSGPCSRQKNVPREIPT